MNRRAAVDPILPLPMIAIFMSVAHAGCRPALEHVDLLGVPGSVAGHRAVAEPLEDGVRVLLDVVEGPEIEGELHRLTVTLAEQRLDVLLEADLFVRGGQ